jgi:hypothetical protein
LHLAPGLLLLVLMGARHLLLSIPLAAVAFAEAACGGASGSGLFGLGADGGSPDGSPSGDAGARDVSADSPPWPSGCPRVQPTEGAACPKNALRCSFGDSPIPECRSAFYCNGTRWLRSDTFGSCPSTAGCPGAPQSDLQCTKPGEVCPYSDGTLCRCGTDVCSGGTSTWHCTSPSTRPVGCPAIIPNEGEPCTLVNTRCDYEPAVTAVCDDGAWSWLPPGCPGGN